MSTAEIAALIISIVLPMLGGFLWLGLKFGRLEQCVKERPDKDWVDARIDRGVGAHRDGCPAYREVTTGGPALPSLRD